MADPTLPDDTPTTPDGPSLRVSPAGIAFVARQEGLRLRAYADPPGQSSTWSIGYGHQLRHGESFPNGITAAQALVLLQDDLRVCEQAVNSLVDVALTQGQFNALCDFTYNEGTGALASSTLRRTLNAGDYDEAAAQFLRWDKVEDGGQLVDDPVLLERRKAEQTMFVEGTAV